MENHHKTKECKKPQKNNKSTSFTQYGEQGTPTKSNAELHAIESQSNHPQYIASQFTQLASNNNSITDTQMETIRAAANILNNAYCARQS